MGASKNTCESKDMGRSFEGLTREERLIRYRLFAEDALEKAQTASSQELRAGFLTMANGWHIMAAELERQMRRGSLPTMVEQDQPEQDKSAH